ncbi:MAG: hypothetical protein KIS92_23375 [Planctomycetota bacterium]|nr:hypothetical protein [Planctomycetota bacterium]
MRRWLLLLVWFLAWAPLRAQEAPAPVAEPPAPKPAPAATADDVSLFEQVLELNRVLEPELDLAAARKAFKDLIDTLREPVAAAATPRQKIAVLNKVLLADREVAYLSNVYWRDATLAASLLRKQGNCISTATLYVCIGEALGLPIRLVEIPNHAFARWDDGTMKINIETTAGGEEVPDEKYPSLREAAPEDVRAYGYGRSLDKNHFVAAMITLAAAHRLGENKFEEALALVEKIQKLAPDRPDLELTILRLLADITGHRAEAREKVHAMLNRREDALPPSVETDALKFLADDAAGYGNYELQRAYLLKAFACAPKSEQISVLRSLAFCHRALKDFRGAVRYMELVEALMPNNAAVLYNLAILQKNDARLDDALASIRKALLINPESWNLQMLEAGYLTLKGDKDAGMQKFVQIERPRGDVEFFESMVAWFYAVYQDRPKFYAQFGKALALARSTHVLEWIDQDVDLDVYRNEPEFKALVAKHAARLRGQTEAAPAEMPAPAQAPQP